METQINYSAPLEFDFKSFNKTFKSKLKDTIKTVEEDKGKEVTKAKREILIFLVDDDILFLKALKQSISSKIAPVSIETFHTGEACLHQMKMNPDIIILDYFLNSEVSYAWNGMTILKQIKKISPKTKVLMLSSQDSLDLANKSIDNGSFDYIPKSQSAFIKINSILENIIDDININERSLKPYQVMALIIVIIALLSLVFNH